MPAVMSHVPPLVEEASQQAWVEASLDQQLISGQLKGQKALQAELLSRRLQHLTHAHPKNPILAFHSRGVIFNIFAPLVTQTARVIRDQVDNHPSPTLYRECLDIALDFHPFIVQCAVSWWKSMNLEVGKEKRLSCAHAVELPQDPNEVNFTARISSFKVLLELHDIALHFQYEPLQATILSKFRHDINHGNVSMLEMEEGIRVAYGRSSSDRNGQVLRQVFLTGLLFFWNSIEEFVDVHTLTTDFPELVSDLRHGEIWIQQNQSRLLTPRHT
ncbi:hypothetical protein BU24DRAFT_492009 [Aaosphaeria arxii CBS 175.79]|uniref:Uncharacterized protein n=1 Tax=Aaosphaeria arxii CBS 175.79 TaxID=1450172 RepID=A0A6A5XRK6_9PLEO|nr:uncharacterized protein BU24DRAFT_492009 [Aaosphaeria arxii CBS 175.79]KAF2015812.1 hypothetical protein BU24DRAFT_492009 [Aaosphaeria arxii CBS 175.79]